RKFEQLDRSPQFLGGSQALDQQADPTGIDHGNLAQVQHNTSITVVHQFIQICPEAVHRVAQIQLAAQFDHLHLAQTANFNVHRAPSTIAKNGPNQQPCDVDTYSTVC